MANGHLVYFIFMTLHKHSCIYCKQCKPASDFVFCGILFTTVFAKVIWAATWQNQQNDLCAQRRLRSAWASTQSDQSHRCPKTDWADAQAVLSLRWAHRSFCWFCQEEAHSFRNTRHKCVKTRLVSLEPRHEKTCLQGLRPGMTQTGLLRDSS